MIENGKVKQDSFRMWDYTFSWVLPGASDGVPHDRSEKPAIPGTWPEVIHSILQRGLLGGENRRGP
jgi:hypothetical protein